MNNKMIIVAAAMLSALLLSSCGEIQIYGQDGVPVPASSVSAPVTPSPTPVPTPTPTPVPTPIPDILVLTAPGREDISVEPSAVSVELPSADYVSPLVSFKDALPALVRISVAGNSVPQSAVDQLLSAFPAAEISYNVTVCGRVYPSDSSEADISSGSPAELEAICSELKRLPALSVINLMREDGTTDYSFEDLAVISSAVPGAAVNLSFRLFGKTVSTADERIEFVKQDIGNGGIDELRRVLPYMNRLEYTLLDSCGIDYDKLAVLRDEFPEKHIVWRVHFSNGVDNYNCLTDVEKIWATGSITDAYSGPLKYCTEVKYMDLGHNCITNIDFVNYMPKLEVLIIAITWVRDISPLANCPNLEYLECFSSEISDISPLANCKKLKHLNISSMRGAGPLSDIRCLYDLPELERLYCTQSYIPAEQQEEMQRRLPDCEFNFSKDDPSLSHWRWENWKEFVTWEQSIRRMVRVPRYAVLCEQFGYDTYDYTR